MKMTTKIIGHAKLSEKFKRLEPAMRAAMQEQIKIQALGLHTEVLKGIQKSSPGKPYVRYTTPAGRKRRRTGIAAAPGHTPNVDTGYMWKNVQIRKTKGIGWDIGWWDKNASYPIALEYGSDKIGLLPRPWLQPAWDKMQKKISSALKNIFKATVARGGK